MKLLHIYAVIILSLFISCESEIITPKIVERSAEYAPFIDGEEQLFEVYDLDYNIFGIDTNHFYLKEIVQVTYKDDDSLYVIINGLTSETLEGEFIATTTKSFVIERNQLIKNTNNERFVVFELPLAQGKTFNTNAYNLQDENEGKIKQLNETVTRSNFLGAQSYLDAMLIEITNINNLILTINHQEVYQKNVGLVYEFDENLDTQPGKDPIGYKRLKIRR